MESTKRSAFWNKTQNNYQINYSFGILFVLLISSVCTNAEKISYKVNEYKEINKSVAEAEMKLLKESEFKTNPDAELSTLVKLGQVAEIFGDSINDQACTLLNKGLKQLNQDSPKTLYHLAESKRLFKCKSLDKISAQIESALQDAKSLFDINDIYYTFLLQKGATSYGAKSQDSFDQFLKSKVKEEWLVNFISDDWSYNSETNGKGLTIESLHIAEMFSSLLTDKELKDKIESKLKSALQKLLNQAYDDESIWFIVTKNANEIDNAQTNFHILTLLNTSMQTISSLSVKADQLLKFRNYFFQKALGAQSLNDFNHALRGLNKLNDYPFVHTESSGIINLGETKAQIKYEFVDMLGAPFTGIKSVKLYLKQSASSPKDMTTHTKFQESKSILTFNAPQSELSLGVYQVIFEVETASKTINLNSSLKVADQIKVSTLQYKLVTTSEFPSSFDQKIEYAGKIKELDIQEGYFLHLSVKAGFAKSSDSRPRQVYLSLKKKGEDKNLYQNVYGNYNVDKERYQITLDLQNDLQHYNGEYELAIHIADFNSVAKGVVWELGNAHIWFKQGQDTGNNQGILEQYIPKNLIYHIFPKSDIYERNLTLPLIGVSGILVAFLLFLKQVFSQNVNLSNISFIGVLLLLNILLILGIFIMFWIKVKLIPTLWILSAISPFSFFIINKALVSADCNIQEVRVGVAKKNN